MISLDTVSELSYQTVKNSIKTRLYWPGFAPCSIYNLTYERFRALIRTSTYWSYLPLPADM